MSSEMVQEICVEEIPRRGSSLEFGCLREGLGTEDYGFFE